MDSIDDRTHGAENYVKRWEPQEGSPGDDVIDALIEAFQDPGERAAATWFDDRHYYEFFPLQAVYRLRKQ